MNLENRKFRMVWVANEYVILSMPASWDDGQCDDRAEEYLQSMLDEVESGYHPMGPEEALDDVVQNRTLVKEIEDDVS